MIASYDKVLGGPVFLDHGVHSAKGDASGQRAMEEEDTGMVSCCRQPSEDEGRLEREREREAESVTTSRELTSGFDFCSRNRFRSLHLNGLENVQ